MLGGAPFELHVALACLLGLLIGSFLNVVIYRLPKMMEQQWAAECAEFADDGVVPPSDAVVAASTTEKFNLLVPRSRCSSCGHVIAWY